MLSKESILNIADITTQEVVVPEWNGSVFVRSMSGAERDAFEAELVEAKKGAGTNLNNVRAKLAVRVVCDKGGTRLFTDADAEQLGRKSAAALDRIFTVAQKLSGIGEKEIAELEGN